MPGTASSPRRQSAKAPTPGSTTRSARATASGSLRHHDRLIVPAFARGALERLGRRVQIARAVIDDGDAHRRAPGSGNRPMTSDAGGGTAPTPARPASRCGAAATPAASRRPRQSKNRRSAASRSSPTTTPSIAASRGAPSVQRRSVAASKPTSSAISKPTTTASPAPTRRAASSADLQRRDADDIDQQHQPQPVPQHPQRRRAGTPRNRSRRARTRNAPDRARSRPLQRRRCSVRGSS